MSGVLPRGALQQVGAPASSLKRMHRECVTRYEGKRLLSGTAGSGTRSRSERLCRETVRAANVMEDGGCSVWISSRLLLSHPSGLLTLVLISRSIVKLEFEWDDAKAEANCRFTV